MMCLSNLAYLRTTGSSPSVDMAAQFGQFLKGISAQQQQSIGLLTDVQDATVREGAATRETITASAQEANTT